MEANLIMQYAVEDGGSGGGGGGIGSGGGRGGIGRLPIQFLYSTHVHNYLGIVQLYSIFQ